ncbi:hypothetical protein Tco_1360964 [Tanacetum coccineum]
MQVLTTVLQPHSKIFGFITTCSYSIFKDIHLASRFKNHESSSIKDKDFCNSDIKDLQIQTKKCSLGRLLALEAFYGRLLPLMKKMHLQAFKMINALTAIVDVPTMYIQQFRKIVRQVLNANETICFMVDTQEITYTMDMFHATLKLPMKTPEQPFIPPPNFDYIQPFLKILGY